MLEVLPLSQPVSSASFTASTADSTSNTSVSTVHFTLIADPDSESSSTRPFPTFLKDDVAAAYTLEVEDFFRTVLGVSNDWVDAKHGALKTVLESQTCREALRGYRYDDRRKVDGVEVVRTSLVKVTQVLVEGGLLNASCSASTTSDVPQNLAEVLVLFPCPSTSVTDVSLQLASAAHKRLSYGSWRPCVLGAIATQDTIQPAYFDHSTIVFSRPFSILQQPILFLTMLCGIGMFFGEACGRDSVRVEHPASYSPRSSLASDTSNSDVRVRLSNGTLLHLGEVIHQQPGLVGRATYVVRVTQVEAKASDNSSWPELGQKKLITKISWPPLDRVSEVDIVRQARVRAVETGNFWVLDHLPDILHCEEYFAEEDELRGRLASRFGGGYVRRVLRMVVEEELQPLVHLRTPIELGTVINDVFRCTFSIFLFTTW